ncbi:MAG: Gfo/Idh/MocA family oxidoreductase [Verrucomicrobiota bacterium]
MSIPSTLSQLSRRDFLHSSIASALLATTASTVGQAPAKRWKGAVIGHSGRGDYGNALDQALARHPDVDLLAVADADPEGLKRAKDRLKAARTYLSYTELLEKERPELVVIAPRHADQHHAMALAALKSGAHICIERPIATTLSEADEILAEAQRRNLKVSVNFQLRLQPGVQWLLKQASSGVYGPLLEMNAVGKQGSKAGGEDLAVLGINLFDMMRAFAGDPKSCNGHIFQNDRDVLASDARIPEDNIGPVAGTAVSAEYYFENGVTGSFDSRLMRGRTIKKNPGRWGLTLRYANENFKINADLPCQIFKYVGGEWKSEGRKDEWVLVQEAPNPPSTPDLLVDSVFPVIEDWIQAIQENRNPINSGIDGLKSLEMVIAVYASTLEEKRIHFPLKSRKHPLLP